MCFYMLNRKTFKYEKKYQYDKKIFFQYSFLENKVK